MSNLGRAEPDVQARASQDGQTNSWERAMLNRVLMGALKEQRAARRWKIFFRFFWTILILGYIIFLMSLRAGSGANVESSDHIAIINIKGTIAAGEDYGSAANINKALNEAFLNESSKAIILRINSPGGSPVQAEMIFDEIRRLRAKYNKPVYAAIEDVGASAAYYIAAAADDIYVSRSAIVGSIGVLTNQFGVVELLDKVGIERRLITSGGHKGMMDPFSPMTPEDKRLMESMLNQVHQSFIAAVKEGRGERLKIDDDTFSGLFWLGGEAVDRGLADKLGTVESIARDVVGVTKMVEYGTRRNAIETLARQFGAGVGDTAIESLQKTGLDLR